MLSKTKFLSNSYKYAKINVFFAENCASLSYRIPSKADEYVTSPEYPSIENNTENLQEEKKRKDCSSKIKRQTTVEEKLFAVNVPRYWGWKCLMVHEGVIPFNNLSFTQHMTRTHLMETKGLPPHYLKTSGICSELVRIHKNSIIDSLEYQLHIRQKQLTANHNLNSLQRDKEVTKIIISELNRIIISSISPDITHIKYLQTDYTPRIESSWEINSMVETFVKKPYKYGIPLDELPEEYLERPSDKFIQYIGQPILQLRHKNPLPNLINSKEADIFSYSVPVFKYDPHLVLGYGMNRRHVTNIPGFWPGDDRECSFLSYHYMNHINGRPYGQQEAMEATQSQIIFASFGWLMSLACYQGFSVYNDVTYPLVTQSIATDGRKFVFAAYQLNTIGTHFKNPYENSKCNICWVTPEMTLFEDYVDGKIKGFNENTLQLLLQLYVNQPNPQLDINLKPYLGQDVKHVADYEDEEKREWLQKQFKHFSANKPHSRTDKMYEVQDWERIFKIQFRMRPMDARRRPFELKENPYHKKMSETLGNYIPRALRPDKHLPKWRQRKRAKTFYPE